MNLATLKDVALLREGRTPIIGIIGATVPTPEYDSSMGVEVGYHLRQYVGKKGGTLFTGGVDGVGVDAYVGVMKRCIDELARFGATKLPSDRFFVLIPYNELQFTRGKFMQKESIRVPYHPPDAYVALGGLSARGHLDVIRAGQDMGERREYVADVADALVVVNGSGGTLDEALNAIERSKRVVILPHSGGAARTLDLIKQGTLSAELEGELAKQGFRSLRRVKTEHLYSARDIGEMLTHLNPLY